MKLAFISTIKNPQLSLEGDLLFTLAQHAFKVDDYIEFYKKQKKYKIVDCGAAEHETVKPEILLDVARELDANEIIVPDKLCVGWRSTLMAKNFFETLSHDEAKKYTFQLVGQGKTPEQYMTNVNNVLNHDLCPPNVILGISKFSSVMSFGNRVRCVKHLIDNGIKNEMHLLGTTDDLAEIVKLKDIAQIRSNDSCIAILAATEGLKFTKDNLSTLKRPVTTNKYFDIQMSEEQILLAKENMKVLKNTQA